MEAVGHVGVAELVIVELLEGRVHRVVGQAHIPAVEGLQGHDSVHQHEAGGHSGKHITPVPRNEIHEPQHERQQQLYPHHAEQTPAGHERQARAAAEQ